MHDRICTIPECGKHENAGGYCKAHYYRWNRYGDPLGVPPVRQPQPPKPKVPCMVDGCDLPHYGHGLCENHYARKRRHGGLHDARAFKTDPAERFWASVDKSCEHWLWTGPPNDSGYGSFNLDGRIIGAHVMAVIVDGREIPPGMHVDHLCYVPMCVRATHLEVVTQLENNQRAWRRRRAQNQSA